MDHAASVVFDCQLDPETLQSIQDLRKIRLEVASKQLQSVPKTIHEMISKGLLPEGDRQKYALELEKELQQKITMLKFRLNDRKTIFADEIELYLELMTDS